MGNIKIVLGNLNAKIGKERIYYSVAGVQSLHEHSNDNGTRLVNFALGKGLIIESVDTQRYTGVTRWEAQELD